jgi:Ser/Thr protein kinase RdoA (MazF antagonist)
MDDREAYLLNGIVQRDFRVGRVIRFRKLSRGSQCESIEILTSERQSFMVLIYPPAYSRRQLNNGARKSNNLSKGTFPSLYFVEPIRGDSGWTVDGPQGSHLMVVKFPVGQPLLREKWNGQDLSQLGVRLAWMHRMTTEVDRRMSEPPLLARLTEVLEEPSPRRDQLLNLLDARALQQFIDGQRGKPSLQGWMHGGINQSSVLMDDDRQITAFIDWGLTGIGSRFEDAVDVFVEWCVDEDGQIRAMEARAFLEAFLSLEPPSEHPDWQSVVDYWCMRQIYHALMGYRRLPRGFGSIIRNPPFLSAAIALCQSKES